MRRRAFLTAGLTGLANLSFPGLLALRASGAASRERTALLVVWLQGGASHLETYDPKPDAPAEVRGPFGAIATKAEGVRISELLPGHARVADRFTVVRSLAHTGFCHQQGNQQMFTGHPEQVLKLKPDHPDLMCVANWLRSDTCAGCRPTSASTRFLTLARRTLARNMSRSRSMATRMRLSFGCPNSG